MKKLLLGSLALIAAFGGSPAGAADLPVYKAAPVAPPVPSYNWTGAYIGVHAGAAWLRGDSNSFADPGNTAFTSCNDCATSWFATLPGGNHVSGVGGVHLGINWQLAPRWLVGVEEDFTFARLSDHRSSALSSTFMQNSQSVPFVVAGSNVQFATDVKWLASIRGRFGFTWDTLLAYFTGGGALAGVDRQGVMSCGPPECLGVGASAATSDHRIGWVVGGGVEWQPSGTHWRWRLEYLYYRFHGDTLFGTNVITVVGGGAGEIVPCQPPGGSCPVSWSFGDLNVHTLRAGLSYSF